MEPKAIPIDRPSSSSDRFSASDAPEWIEPVARAGYAGKGVVYAVIGGLAVQLAIGSGGQTSGSRGALREIAAAPFGQVALGLVAVGLAGYVTWRFVQAIWDPEGKVSDDDKRRWGMRLFYLGSGVTYGLLTYYAFSLLLGYEGGGSAAGAGGSGGGSGNGWVTQVMSMAWGAILVGGVGVGIVIRGIFQFVKAYNKTFEEGISARELGHTTEKWVMRASRLGLTARGVVFTIIGSSVLYAAAIRDSNQARGLEGVLDFLTTRPWLLGGLGAGLIGYAIYQWAKARYRLIGV